MMIVTMLIGLMIVIAASDWWASENLNLTTLASHPINDAEADNK